MLNYNRTGQTGTEDRDIRAQLFGNPVHRLIALTSINHCCFAGVRFAVTLYAVQLQASHATVGLMIAAFSVFSALTSVASGRWADRVGARLPMLVGSAAMVAGCLLAFAWSNLLALFVASAVVGTLYNVYFIAQQQLLGQYGSPEDRVRNFSLSSLGFAAANFVAPLAAGIALDEIGYAETFAALALIPLIPIGIILAGRIPFPEPRAEAPGARARHGGVLSLLGGAELRLLYTLSLMTTTTWQLFTFLIPLYGIEIGLSAFQIGLVVGSFSLATVLSRLAIGLFSRRFTPWTILLAALVASAVALALLGLLRQQAALLAVSFWLGLALGTCNPIAQALLYNAAPSQRVAEVLGLRVMMANGMQAAVPILAGTISALFGMTPVFVAMAAGLLGGCYAGRDRFGRRAPPA